jgi:hypothetical protein
VLKVFDEYWDLSQLMYELVDDQFTMVHVAVSLGRYKVMWYFIEKHNFDIDYYREPLQRMTLLHVIAKYHTSNYLEEDKANIIRLIKNSSNLLLRNNFGRTIFTLAESIQGKGCENAMFLKAEISKQILSRMVIMADIIHRAINKGASEKQKQS